MTEEMIKNNGYIKALHQKQQSILDSMDKNDIDCYILSNLLDYDKEKMGKLIVEKEKEYIELKKELNKNMELSSMKKRFFFKKLRQKSLDNKFTKIYNKLKHDEKVLCICYSYYDEM